MVRQRKMDSTAKRQAVMATIAAMVNTGTPITVAGIAPDAHGSAHGLYGRSP